MEDSSGFYKLDGVVLYAPNFALNTDYELHRETYEQNTYPIDGWYWFNTIEEAYSFFKLPLNSVNSIE